MLQWEVSMNNIALIRREDAKGLSGSIYILILVAVQNLRVPLGGVDGHAARHIGNMLRHPDGEPFG